MALVGEAIRSEWDPISVERLKQIEHPGYQVTSSDVTELCRSLKMAAYDATRCARERDEEIERVSMLREEIGKLYQMARDGQLEENDPLAWLELIEQQAEKASGKVSRNAGG